VARFRRRSNIYDLVERAAARHGIPRLQLWQETAKALCQGRLPILNDLSEQLNFIALWLPGFSAAVDRHNDPNRGMVRILKNVFVNEAVFESWFRKAMKRRGPPSGTTGFRDADRKLFPQILRLIKHGKARSAYGAALILEREGKLVGSATPENKAKRVAKFFLREHR
jgi:hypothetical protein